MAKVVETPLMKQYFDIKAKHPDAILLFRVGDFYEMYGEDAVIGAEILGIVQTKRANGVGQHVEMAGFPHHALDSYLPKLVRAGKRVAICDQLEDPKLTKKLVKRGITELVTPGVSINDNILNHKENNFLASIHFAKEVCGISFLDISTGEFMTAEGSIDYIDKLLNNFSPKEVLIERGNKKRFEEAFGRQRQMCIRDSRRGSPVEAFRDEELEGFWRTTLEIRYYRFRGDSVLSGPDPAYAYFPYHRFIPYRGGSIRPLG